MNENKENRYPEIGPFYFYKNKIIIPIDFQRKVNPTTFDIEKAEDFIPPGEHRDAWDKYMTIKYPELKIDYDDDHKALPRGRVDCSVEHNELTFFITLDKCIKGKESMIKRLYKVEPYKVDFLYGVMNYKCKYCNRKLKLASSPDQLETDRLTEEIYTSSRKSSNTNLMLSNLSV